MQFETRHQQVEERLHARAIRRGAIDHRGRRTWFRSFLMAGPLVGLPRSERKALRRLTSRFDAPAGKRLLSQGGFADAFFLVERGEVSVIGRSGPIADLGAGDFFGEIGLIKQRPRTASIVATTDVRLHVIPELDFAHAMRSLPTFARIVGNAANLRLSRGPVTRGPAEVSA
jgi:CRP-like cAMP-binding protein